MKKTLLLFLLLICIHFTVSAQDIRELPFGTSGNRVYVTEGTFSGEPFVITDDLEFCDISSNLYYFFDSEKNKTPQSVLKHEFSPVNGRVAWGFQDAECWFKFDYISRVSAPKEINIEVLVTGFPITIHPDEKGTILIYLNYPAGIISTTRLFSAYQYKLRNNSRIALNALLLGINLALILYNLIIFIWTKDISFLYFVFYLLTLSFHIYLREDYISNIFPFLKDYFFSIPPLVFATLFAQRIFNTKKKLPVNHKILNIAVAAGILLTILCILFRSTSSIVQVVLTYYKCILLVYELGLIIYLCFKKDKKALYLFISWIPLIVSVLLLQLEQFGVLQTNNPFLFFIMREGFYLAAAFQAVLVSIVIAQKINYFRTREELARKEKESLEEMDRIKTNFIMNISHEFRTPLTLILGTVDNFRSCSFGNSIPWNHRAFDVIKRNASRLLLLINNLLKIMRFDLFKYKLNEKEVSINKYMLFIIEEFESLARKYNITLVYENRMEEELFVKADFELLETVTLNLLSNAFKFTPPEGKITVTLESYFNNSAGECAVSFQDTGPGIPAEKMDTVFRRFYQINYPDKSNKTCKTEFIEYKKPEGFGIGLSLVAEAVKLLNGRVTAGNHEEGGAVFTVYLPALKTENSKEQKSFTATQNISLYKESMSKYHFGEDHKVKQNKRPPVLLIEDNSDLREFIMEGLKSDFNIYSVENGKKALEWLEKESRPHLILSDIMMPEMDGLELFRTLRQRKTNDIPFVFLTARASDEEKIQAISEGAVDYIFKPFSIKELTVKINSLISLKRETIKYYKNNVKEKIINIFEEADRDTGKIEKESRLNGFIKKYALSSRQKDILKLFIQGLRDKEIAKKLDIATSTVSNQLSRIYMKVGALGRIDLLQKINEYTKQYR